MKSATRKTYLIYWDHARRYQSGVILSLAGLLVAVAADVAAPLFYKRFFDLLGAAGGRETLVPALIRLILIVFGIHLAGWAAFRVSMFSITWLEARVMSDLKDTSFEYLHGHSYSFFANRFAGALVQKISRFSSSFEGVFDQIVMNLFPLSLRILAVLGVLWYTNSKLGLLMSAWVLLFLASNYFLTVYKLKYDLQAAEADTRTTARLADSITNNVNIKLFTALKEEFRSFKTYTEEQFQIRRRSWNLGTSIDALQALLTVVFEFLIFYVAIFGWREGRISVGDFVLIQAYIIAILQQMWGFGRMVRNLYKNLADAEEMTLILSLPHEIVDAEGVKDLTVRTGAVSFRGVSFRYSDGRMVLKDLDLDIKPGEKVGIVGPSGAGKTTLVKLLFRFYDLTEGEILIDGTNIADVSQNSLRRAIALVPQDPILFHRSLMENIRYGRRDASEAEVLQAARAAHCDEFIEELSEGYDTFVGERGIKLSGGERQRIAIARAILMNSPILVLDEATSSLDSHSEALIQDALEHLMRRKTTIVIAHRLSTIMKMDRIVVLKGGELLESGTHQELLKSSGSLYQKLWRLQAGGFVS